MIHFRCRCCGETHEGLADIAFEAPYYYYAVPEAERERRCRLDADFCTIDDQHYFVRGCLEIPILGRDQHFAWGAWCSLSHENFERYARIFGERQSHVGPFFGWLSVQVPTYPDTLRLKVMAHLQDQGIRPRFVLEPTEHPLAVDHRRGITLDRLQQIYEASLHPVDRG